MFPTNMNEDKIVKPIYSGGEKPTPIPKVEPTNEESQSQQKVAKLEAGETLAVDKKDEADLISNLSDIDPELHYLADPMFFEIMDYFGLDRRVADVDRDKLQRIIRFIKEESKKTSKHPLLVLREFESKLNTPGIGERRHSIVYRYLVLKGRESELKKEMSAWEK